MKNKKGQVLISTIILIPLIWLCLGLLVRTGTTAQIHNRVQNFLDRRALDSLTKQALALESLGKLNYYAGVIIDSRRSVDALLATPYLNVTLMTQLLAARAALVKKQKEISFIQNIIKQTGLSDSLTELKREFPSDLQEKITDHFDLPRRFFISVQKNYQGEVGAPLKLNSNFQDKQKVEIHAEVKTENFLQPWLNFYKSSNMKLSSTAEIKMNSMEEKWEVHLLRQTEGRL
jgi:hypothetical protein